MYPGIFNNFASMLSMKLVSELYQLKRSSFSVIEVTGIGKFVASD
jgi:hypothetical protein